MILAMILLVAASASQAPGPAIVHEQSYTYCLEYNLRIQPNRSPKQFEADLKSARDEFERSLAYARTHCIGAKP